MDNIPKDNEEGQNQPTGEIFSGSGEESAYGEATAAPQTGAGLTPDAPYGENLAQPPIEAPADPSADGPPPPFAENDNKKKFIVFGGVGLVILLFIIFVFNLISSGKPKNPQAVTLNYWGLWEDKEIMQPIIDDYKKIHSNVTVNYMKQDPKQYRDRLKVAADKGDGPDIFRFHNTWVPMLKSYLSAMPQNVYSTSDFEKTFFPVATADLKTNGNIYGIPLMIDGLLLFYNDDMLKGANVTVPSTWIDVQNTLPKLTVKQNGKIVTAGIAMGTAENIEHFSDILALMMLQNGTKLEQSLLSCADPSNTTCGIETLTYYRKIAETPNNSWDETLDNSIVAFAGGKVAMIFAPSWEIYTIKTLSPNLNFKTAKMPQLPCDKQPCATVNWGTYWVEGVSSKSKYQKEAWEFLKYLSDINTMKKLYELEVKSRPLFGEPYSRVDLAKSLADNPYIGPLMAEAPTMKSFYLASRTNDGDTGLNSTLITYLKNAVNSLSAGVSSETAVKTANEGFKQVYIRFGLSAPAPTQ